MGQTQRAAASKFRFRGIVPGVSQYSRLVTVIDWLESAGLVIKVPIANSGEIPSLAFTKENTFKLYGFDVGILGAMSQLPPETILNYDYGTYKGYFAENFVASEFLSTGTTHLYCWKEGTAEIEFIREIEGNIIPVEVKSGWIKRAKSLKVFADKYHPAYRTIISARNFRLNHHRGIHYYPLYLAARFPLSSASSDSFSG